MWRNIVDIDVYSLVFVLDDELGASGFLGSWSTSSGVSGKMVVGGRPATCELYQGIWERWPWRQRGL